MCVAGESGFCYVHQVSGTLLQDYRHPGPVYGCDWRDADVLATGCEDGRIRIFCVTKNRKEPVTELKGLFVIGYHCRIDNLFIIFFQIENSRKVI